MPDYFLDTSAIVKRYVPERGCQWVRRICRSDARHRVMIAEIALVEVVASLSRMVRESPPRLLIVDRERLISLFRRHVQRSYDIVPVARVTLTRAADLCRTHPLRAYDAVQLASALTIRDETLMAGITPPVFVCADTALLSIAAAEGLVTDNPNDHP
ncbi:MAG TPA: type II toxin-antitoxin system VapC family toxin [Ktedonobacterales bacterium]|nr:type II toxin-antitoxin system VapC family toxin [Ktedonobacterales bacterium]